MRVIAVCAALVACVAFAEPPRRVLRVCADPNNLPFSNAKQEGFENRLAELVAKALGADLQYEWFPQRRGFVRQTLKAGRCDVVMGVPSGYELVATTRPYYRSGYALVLGPKAPRVRSLDAPELKTLRIGVPLVGEDGANPPPVLALAERKLLSNVKGYLVTGDYSQDSPPSKLIGAVRGGEVDLAVAWGPLAGYFARHASPALEVVLLPMSEAPRGQTFGFDISMGVLRKNTALRDELDQVIERQHDEIAHVLDAFSVPRLPLAAGSTP
jgi:mxaJ protein